MGILLETFLFGFCLIAELMSPRDDINIVYRGCKQLLYFHSVYKRETKIAYALKFVTIYYDIFYVMSQKRN